MAGSMAGRFDASEFIVSDGDGIAFFKI